MTELQHRARQWKKFRKKHYFSQERLAQVLGISRRAVQYVEAGQLTPHASTLFKFEVLRIKHGGNKSTSPSIW